MDIHYKTPIKCMSCGAYFDRVDDEFNYCCRCGCHEGYDEIFKVHVDTRKQYLAHGTNADGENTYYPEETGWVDKPVK